MTDPSCCRWKAGLLGLFVAWQLVYLPAANLVQFVPLRVRADPGDVPLSMQTVGRFTDDDRLQSLADTAGAGFSRYAEVSGQVQFWKLFTPELPPTTIVLVTRIEWADGRTAEVVSPSAPPDNLPAFRLPRWNLRPFHMDVSVGLGPWAVPPERAIREHDAARELTVDWAAARTRSARIVMRHHWTIYQAEHSNEPDPVSLTLVTRFHRKPGLRDPRSTTARVTDRPFVRWLDPFGPEERVEAFDPVANKFLPVPEGRP